VVTIQDIFNLLGKQRFMLDNEKAVQRGIEDIFIAANIPYDREFMLDKHSIPDFMLNGICVEVKIKGSKREIFKQLERYSLSELVTHIILVTNVSMGLPSDINGKPAYLLNLSRAWL
jgi:hypothetical protein